MTVLRSGPLNRPRGGSISWQGSAPGPTLLRASFFDATVSDAGYVPVWTGAAYVRKPTKAWTGSAWVIKPAKDWTGAAWTTT